MSDKGNVMLRRSGTVLGAMIAGWAGVLHVALAIVPPFALTREADQPSWTDAPGAIVAFYQGASFDPGFMTGILMEAVSFVLLLVIVTKLADLVGGADGGSRWIGWLIVGAVVLEMAFGIFGYLAPYVAAVFRADHGGLSDAGYLALHDLRFAFYWLDLVVLPFWMVPLGVAIIRTRAFAPWLGWALIVNAVALLPTLYLSVDIWDPVSGIPSIWILVMAVLMIWHPERYARVSDAPATQAAAEY
ncbi:MAG TPA: hypothetical protein VK838_04155 [Candidatus Limnocylindrales bacterium]|nr:hypothetical protein [Candidatus Limnocylindrales bacterium]